MLKISNLLADGGKIIFPEQLSLPAASGVLFYELLAFSVMNIL